MRIAIYTCFSICIKYQTFFITLPFFKQCIFRHFKITLVLCDTIYINFSFADTFLLSDSDKCLSLITTLSKSIKVNLLLYIIRNIMYIIYNNNVGIYNTLMQESVLFLHMCLRCFSNKHPLYNRDVMISNNFGKKR